MDVPSLNNAASPIITGTGPTVAIIGCGPAGMFFLRQLEKERNQLLKDLEELELKLDSTVSTTTKSTTTTTRNKLDTLPQVTVFEKESRCGGLWQSKLAKKSNADSTSEEEEGMYDGMWINAPKEIFEFEDYTFHDHYNGTSQTIPSYIVRSQVLDYIVGATQESMKYHLGKGNIQFNTQVTYIDEYVNENENESIENENENESIDEDDDDDDEDNNKKKTSKFEISTIPTGTPPKSVLDNGDVEYNPDDITHHIFDKIILANGNEASPNIPDTVKQILQPPQPQEEKEDEDDDIENDSGHQIKFDGPVLHSSQINQLGSDIRNKRFLFIGSAYSAEDLALSFIKRGAQHIYVTTRSDSGYPVTVTSSWPMNKLTILYRTEIKSVIDGGDGSNNNLLMGRMDIPSGTPKELLDYYNNQTIITNSANNILENIDAVIFCTGYQTDEDILSSKLNIYNYEKEAPYNYYLNPDLVQPSSSSSEQGRDNPDYWPNVYDTTKFGNVELPSETNHNRCGGYSFTNNNTDDDAEQDHTPVLRADPSIGLWHHQYLGLYNNHLIHNPNFYKHRVESDTPLLGLDISSAFILKVMIGDIDEDTTNTNTDTNTNTNTKMTKDEMFIENSREMFHYIRHSRTTRYIQDEIFRNAFDKVYFVNDIFANDEAMCVYDHGYPVFKLFLKAYIAGHPAGSMIMKINDGSVNNNNTDTDTDMATDYYYDKDGRRPVYTDRYGYNDNDNDNDDDDVFHDFHKGSKWTFSDRGMKFLNYTRDSGRSREDIPLNTNLTFRDMYYEKSFESMYTGIKPRKFSKLWLDIDDIVGDIDVDTTSDDDNQNILIPNGGEATTSDDVNVNGDSDDDDDDGSSSSSSCLHCEQQQTEL